MTGLRFFLAAHVLFFHFAPRFFGGSAFARNFVEAGISAIPGFFLLSGFILTYAHVCYPGRIDQPIGKFWLARFLRIYPAYFLAFLFAAPFALARFRHTAVSLHTLADTGAFLMLLQTWIPDLWSFWNYPAWSLSVEAFFYVLFPILVPPIFRCRWNWRVMIGAVWIGGLVVPITLLGAIQFEWLLKLPPLHLPEFIFGMILGNRLIPDSAHAEPALKRTSAWLAPVTAAILVACYGSGWFPGSLIEHGLFAPLMGCVLWGLTRGGGWFAALLGSKPLVYLGEISYGIYIFQFPVFVGCFAVTKRLRLPWDSRATFLVCSAILVGVSAVSFELVEKPLRRAMMRRYDRRLRAAEPIAAALS